MTTTTIKQIKQCPVCGKQLTTDGMHTMDAAHFGKFADQWEINAQVHLFER